MRIPRSSLYANTGFIFWVVLGFLAAFAPFCDSAFAQTAAPTGQTEKNSASAWTESKLGNIEAFLVGGLNYQMGGEKYAVPYFGLRLEAPTELPVENWKIFSSVDLNYSALPTRQDRSETFVGMKDVFSTSLSATIFNTTSRLGASLGYSIDQSQNSVLLGTMPEIGVGHRYENGHVEARIFNAKFEDRREHESSDVQGTIGQLTGVCVLDEHQVSDLVRLRTILKAGWLSHMGESSAGQGGTEVGPNEGSNGTFVKVCMAPLMTVSENASIGLAGIYEGYSYRTKLSRSSSTSNLSLRLFGEVAF